ncbi:proline--tRNA ligase [Arachnia rubra]|uniref:Proline--tRNA ligase n=1 Tax=Arachnia rubra TaxID=1547448 RepID=A0ABX7Y1Q4_9ACTN|nr:proline--tRNA ligase [Arachnia rubra]MBB1571371.1 proline--tRNA ligase [Propionibacterium sp.]MDO4644619.1 proline--tRNA ligase [Propionibacteriaceae bacterium]QUC07104.1 proline--tRNA ligase [Arachnia rubra]BCR81354.1 proline--tRNA ligase [Arachnia rubra]
MITRLSQLFVRTLRDDPADAEVSSHRWLVRAGYVRRVTPGIYSWLPLGLKVLQKVEAIVREEMEAMGAQEVRFPALLPREPYETTGRWTEYGENLFRLRDRRDADMLLGPTHEEMFTLMVGDLYSSYKDLPLSLYQIQTKYRDEARPRAGLLRGREFVMKDSYSFDVDDAGLAASYQAHRDAYIRIFDRLGLEYVIVKATSGAMGGSASEEFLAVLPAGEDTFVRSPGGYAANVEAVTVAPAPAIDFTDAPEATVVDTPGTPTIASLVAVLNAEYPRGDREWTAADTLKNVVLKVTEPTGETWPLAIGLPGDREVDPKRLEAALAPAEAAPFEEADFAAHLALVKGYIGPGALGKESPSKVKYLVDPRVSSGTSWVTGADEQGRHVLHLVTGRDFTPDGFIDVAEMREGDPAPDGSGPLALARGIEMGHIFQLGRKYAEALGLKVLDSNGKLVTVTMGSYGVGVSRAVAAVAEATCDDKGLAWPLELAPYQVQVLVTGKDQEMSQTAEDLAGQLSGVGLDVLYDDRKASPGVKFTDAEVLGMPIAVVVGRGLKNGVVEVRNRRTGERREVPVAEAVTAVRELTGR